MFPCNDVLMGLLAERTDLYEKLGLFDIHVGDAPGGAAVGAPVGHSVVNEPIEALEGRIADVNRRIARLRGPITDGLAFDLN